MVNASIWRDTTYTASTGYMAYSITLNGELVFAGKAYERPDGDGIRININRVCQQYLYQDLDTILNGASTMINAAASRGFELRNEGDIVIESYRFIDCWDKDFNWTGQNTTLSEEICGDYAPGMLRLQTNVTNGVVTTQTLSNPTNIGCVDYALYYVGMKGGWNSFAIQGTGLKKDTITPYSMNRVFNNTTREFEKDRYTSEIATSYELNTHYLTDEQSANLAKNLVGSNKVYLHDLKEGKIIPVVINDTSVSYQTYRTNGKRLAQYKINITESQTKTRR